MAAPLGREGLVAAVMPGSADAGATPVGAGRFKGLAFAPARPLPSATVDAAVGAATTTPAPAANPPGDGTPITGPAPPPSCHPKPCEAPGWWTRSGQEASPRRDASAIRIRPPGEDASRRRLIPT